MRVGADGHLVGRSHECLYPPTILDHPVVTRSLIPPDLPSREIDHLVSETLATHATLYTLDLQLLSELKPDLILTQSLCSVCAVPYNSVQEAVASLHPTPRVINLEPTTLQDVVQTFYQVAEAVGMPERASGLVEQFYARIRALRKKVQTAPPVKVSFFEWGDPLFTCGHWTPELVALAGGTDGHSRPGQPSRRMDWQEVLNWQPEAIVIACCGLSVERTSQDLPAVQSLPGWDDLPAVRLGNLFIADGIAYFSCPSPRLVDALQWLADCLEQARNTLRHYSTP